MNWRTHARAMLSELTSFENTILYCCNESQQPADGSGLTCIPQGTDSGSAATARRAYRRIDRFRGRRRTRPAALGTVRRKRHHHR